MQENLLKRLLVGDIVQIGLCRSNSALNDLFLRIVRIDASFGDYTVVSLSFHTSFGDRITPGEIDRQSWLHVLDDGHSWFYIHSKYFKDFYIRNGRRHE